MKPQEVLASKLPILGLILVFSLAGCANCQDCELNGTTETICETEFDNTGQYQDAIADREAMGATCTASSGGF